MPGSLPENPVAAALARRIEAALQDRPLPIQIGPAERVTDLARYARTEARSALSPSPVVAAAAMDRLTRLGLDVPALLAQATMEAGA